MTHGIQDLVATNNTSFWKNQSRSKQAANVWSRQFSLPPWRSSKCGISLIIGMRRTANWLISAAIQSNRCRIHWPDFARCLKRSGSGVSAKMPPSPSKFSCRTVNPQILRFGMLQSPNFDRHCAGLFLGRSYFPTVFN